MSSCFVSNSNKSNTSTRRMLAYFSWFLSRFLKKNVKVSYFYETYACVF